MSSHDLQNDGGEGLSSPQSPLKTLEPRLKFEKECHQQRIKSHNEMPQDVLESPVHGLEVQEVVTNYQVIPAKRPRGNTGFLTSLPTPAVPKTIWSTSLKATEYRKVSEVLLGIAESALKTCLEEHQPKCSQYPFDSRDFLPTRLIDLEDVEHPRLIITSETEIQDRRYVPLSHRWGKLDDDQRRAMTTTQENLDSRKNGFDLETLPQRYQEIFLLCYNMGVRYIWIDFLCIIQGSSEDWHSECGQMASVYECGLFTIASNLPDHEQSWEAPHYLTWAATNLWRGGPNKAWLNELLVKGPLAMRGWCLQERHLSPRILHIFHDKVWVWECDSRVRGSNVKGFIFASDVVDDRASWRKLPSTWPSGDEQSERLLFQAWANIVEDYTRRQLTYDSDIFPAISGIVTKIQPLISSNYLAGVWEKDLLGLMWFGSKIIITPQNSDIQSKHEKDVEKLMIDPQFRIAPSWSWASTRRPISFSVQSLKEKKKQNSFIDEYGFIEPMRRGDCVIRARLIKHLILHDKCGSYITLSGSIAQYVSPLPRRNIFPRMGVSLDNLEDFGIVDPEISYTSHDFFESLQMRFLILGAHSAQDNSEHKFGLALFPSKLHQGKYFRIGIFILLVDAKDSKVLRLLPESEISIV